MIHCPSQSPPYFQRSVHSRALGDSVEFLVYENCFFFLSYFQPKITRTSFSIFILLLRVALQMASLTSCRSQLSLYMRPTSRFNVARALTTTTTTLGTSSTTPPASALPNTHFKITLRRSAISLGDKIKGTLKALGIHRRFQTVYFPHSPEVAGKILKVKELVEVENVPRHLVLTKQEQRQQRKSPRGYKIVGSRMTTFMHV
jgi:large subunit ribosomal protein L30